MIAACCLETIWWPGSQYDLGGGQAGHKEGVPRADVQMRPNEQP